jgi:hypothetical protein
VSSTPLAGRVAALDWAAVRAQLDLRGFAILEKLLDTEECRATACLWDDERCFRSRVVMASHGYGQGEYRYFAYPLPPLVAELRASLYARLAPLADRWSEALRSPVRYPAAHSDFIARCRAAGQTRPTPLLLHYVAGDYNRLHQDLYGEHVFPLQVAILLCEPQTDFTGGEFVLTESRPRMQSRVEVLPLRRGDAALFAVDRRPAQGARGIHRAQMRHGVSRLHSGRRVTLGVIFHDAS